MRCSCNRDKERLERFRLVRQFAQEILTWPIAILRAGLAQPKTIELAKEAQAKNERSLPADVS